MVVAMRLYLAPLLDVLLDWDQRPALVLDVDDIESQSQRELGHLEEASRFERLEAVYLPSLDRVIVDGEAAHARQAPAWRHAERYDSSRGSVRLHS